MNPLREIRMLGQDRPLDELYAETQNRPRVDYCISPAPRGRVRYRAFAAKTAGFIEGIEDTREEAIEAAVQAKRRLEAMAQ